MKILVTGPTGFIGQAFIRLALSHGHQIAGLIIPSEPIPTIFSQSAEASPPSFPLSPSDTERAGGSCLWLRGTLEDAPWKEIAAFRPDVCVHMAWITTPGIYLESPENFRFLEASISFLRKLREIGASHIFGLGTCIEYQITNQPLSEARTPAMPTTTYSRCKNDLRLAMEADAKEQGFLFSWGRVFYPYGPREHPSRLCSSILSKLAGNEKIVLKTPDSTKDYIYIDDLASALLTVIEKKFSGIVNLGTGIGVSVRQIAETLGQMMGKPQLIAEAAPPEIDPLGYVVADASRLHQLGWQPAHDLRRGLQKLIEARGSR